jgi:hypothetical protein
MECCCFFVSLRTCRDFSNVSYLRENTCADNASFFSVLLLLRRICCDSPLEAAEGRAKGVILDIREDEMLMRRTERGEWAREQHTVVHVTHEAPVSGSLFFYCIYYFFPQVPTNYILYANVPYLSASLLPNFSLSCLYTQWYLEPPGPSGPLPLTPPRLPVLEGKGAERLPLQCVSEQFDPTRRGLVKLGVEAVQGLRQLGIKRTEVRRVLGPLFSYACLL